MDLDPPGSDPRGEGALRHVHRTPEVGDQPPGAVAVQVQDPGPVHLPLEGEKQGVLVPRHHQAGGRVARVVPDVALVLEVHQSSGRNGGSTGVAMR